MKFSIRDVLWLTVVVALAVCWGIDRLQFQQVQVNALRAELGAKMEAQRAIVAEQQARANAEIASAVQAQLRSTATTSDPRAVPPTTNTAP